MGMLWRGSHKFKGYTQFLAGVTGIFPERGNGKVFWVNGESGDNDNLPGTNPDKPLLTIGAALALCTNYAHDIVCVTNYSSQAQAVETWPIPVTVHQVHIVGVGHKGDKMVTVHATGTDKSAFLVTGNRVELANLEIAGKSGGSGAGVLVGDASGNGWGCYIHDCWFSVPRAPGASCANGVYVASGYDAPYLRIEDCEFTNALTAAAILIAGNATRGTIANNSFMQCTCAISVTGGAVSLKIFDNKIYMDADTSGHGIALGASTSGCFITGNQAAVTESKPSAGYAFVDATTNANAWGINYSGSTAVLVAG
jgi:hypothetical protein